MDLAGLLANDTSSMVYRPAEANLLLGAVMVFGLVFLTSTTIWLKNRVWFKEYLGMANSENTYTLKGKLKNAGIIFFLRIIPVFSLTGFCAFLLMYFACIG